MVNRSRPPAIQLHQPHTRVMVPIGLRRSIGGRFLPLRHFAQVGIWGGDEADKVQVRIDVRG
jgi:hypothetical protein